MQLGTMRDIVSEARAITRPMCSGTYHFKLKENRKARDANSPYAVWDVLVRQKGQTRGRCIASLIHPLNTKFQ